MRLRILMVWLALQLASCGSPRATEIVLLVATDIAEADAFVVDATYPSGRMGTSSVDLRTQPAPRVLVLRHTAGPLGPVGLTVTAMQSGSPIVQVERAVTFEEGETLTLSIFLPGACAAASCGGQTCGDTGSCRAREVLPCEYEGRVCGQTDAGSGDGGADAGRDAGGCAVAAAGVCGVAAEHLAGDRIVPAPCGPLGGSVTTRVTGPGGARSADASGGFLLDAQGSYTVRIEESATCFAETDLTVVAPTDVPGSALTGTYRDLAARVGAAFVASPDGPFGVDLAGWHDLRSIDTGDPLSTDQAAVCVQGAQPIFGPNQDDDELLRVEVDAGFTRATVTSIPIGGGDKRVRALASRIDGRGPVVAATRDEPVVVSGLGTATPRFTELRPFDPGGNGWAAIGSVESVVGAIWVGSLTEVVNRSIRGGPEFNDGDAAGLPFDIEEGELDDRVAGDHVLWLCGESGVRIHRIAAGWDALDSLPTPDATYTGNACLDLAVDESGDAWIAMGGAGLGRLGRDGVLRAVYVGSSADRVATAHDAGSREVWFLDAGAGRMRVLAADPIPAAP